MAQPKFLERIGPQVGKDPKRKSRVIFYGDSPTCATGFGQVSRNILPALYETGRYEVDILGINYWGDPHDYPFKIWPMAVNNQRDPYGRQRLQQHLHDPRLDFDILFFLQDTFILEFVPALVESLKKSGKKFKSVFYYPVDGIPKESWIRAANAVDYPVTYSQFAREQSIKLVPEIAERLQVVPHGVNPEVFFPAPKAQVQHFRKQFFGPQADKFIMTNINRNQQRKDIPATIRAFKEFKKHRPDSVLYLHMAAVDQGWNLPEVIKAFELDIRSDVILPQNFTPSNGFPLEVVNMIYNASDCVVSTTVGEGWGLSWTEAMATKTPVVFPINTCLGEYITEETGFPYPSGGDPDHITVLPHDNEVPRPTSHVGKMVEQLIYLHDNPEEAARRAENAYGMVSSTLFWNEHINPRWVELFDKIVKDQTSPSQKALDITKPVVKGEML
ncbi:MAG: glycosyltransferase [Candidatus Altiarchaeales archaeon]|nr:glycosyltransferase [Candidatus Altiarchaeales archaeon]